MRFIFFLILFLPFSVFSQKYDNKYFNKALEYYQDNDVVRAKKHLYIILKDDRTHPQANILLGQIYEDKNQINKSLDYYDIAMEELISQNYDFTEEKLSQLIYRVSNLHFNMGNYIKSKYYMSHCEYENYHKEFAERINFAIQLKENPVDFIPVNLGNIINSESDEYLPFVARDNNLLFFTKNNQQEDIYVSYDTRMRGVVDNVWGTPHKLPINTSFNEGGGTLSKDGRIFFFTSCERDEVVGGRGCDIYVSFNENDSWSKPINLVYINTEYWESQPCLSEDGRELYFVSNRPGGYGKMDIWKSEITENSFSQPVNLGSNVNTSGHEMSPFIHSDNITLYFASDYHFGMGGHDIFYSRKIDKNWSKPQNIGYPINTYNDENSLVVSSNGTTAYFASDNLEQGFGRMDLYRFNMPLSSQSFNVVDSEPIILRNIFFKYNSHEILSKSEKELMKLVSFLRNNSSVDISIYGHTDNVGSDKFNLELSNLRAMSVYNYLLKKEINSSRLSYYGKGKCCPVASNKTEFGRSQNRRIEFIID